MKKCLIFLLIPIFLKRLFTTSIIVEIIFYNKLKDFTSIFSKTY